MSFALRSGVPGTLAAQVSMPASAVLSMPAVPSAPVVGRLSVRPRQMATGIRTERAGSQQVEIREGVAAEVYVPLQCVGTRRCPLVVCMGYYAGCVPSALADKYGLILLDAAWGASPALRNAVVDPGVPELFRETGADSAGKQFVHDVDTALTRLLRQFAIDPAKIAIFGNSYGGFRSAFLGSVNPDVFSRIAPRSTGGSAYESPVPTPPTTQFYFSGGMTDLDNFYGTMRIALSKRRDGHSVRIGLTPKEHSPDMMEAANLFRWLHDSWAAPDSARRAARPRQTTAMPLLTADALARWTAFWSRFMQEPDSIRDGARMAHFKEVPMLLGGEPVTLLVTDLPTLAAKYPAIAADLEAAGLTARRAEAYRIALLSAWSTLRMRQTGDNSWGGDIIGVAASASVLGKNMAFLRTQPERTLPDGDPDRCLGPAHAERRAGRV